MFEQLFERPHALARHHASPLFEERRRFLVYVADRGVSRDTLRHIADYLLRIIEALDLAKRPHKSITRDEIKRKSVDGAFASVATRWLQFLGRLEQPPICPNPYAEKVRAFADYLQNEKGLSPVTVKRRAEVALRFLGRLGDPNGSLRETIITEIDGMFLMALRDGYARLSVKTWANELRTFFRYAEMRGWCRKGLAQAIEGPRTYSQVTLPGGPSWDDVRRLLAVTEGNRPMDIRDRAILMFLAIYGLRAGEVNRLRLDDFDWQQELLSVVCRKVRWTRTYPLIRPVGDAVLRYLKEVRPHSDRRETFLTMVRPFRPLHGATIWNIVAIRLQRLGIATPHYGPHALRHACATHLLAQGLSLKEIGDHLGHRKPDTTRIYAKVDLIGLRQVADFDLGGLL